MEGSYLSQHHIVQTLFGPVCTSCVSRVNGNKTLFTCTDKTIKKHWEEKKCYSGNPHPATVERELLERLKHMHSAAIGNPQLAFEHFKEGDEGVKRTRRHHCSHCGLVDLALGAPGRCSVANLAGPRRCPPYPVSHLTQIDPSHFYRETRRN